ncbi:hypothetical protein GOV10_00775 [Candidatus Woesearchaeota archaeon]|nr:hypothetical protein [Candidatus Woesearchaeota archaeon]
MSLESKVEEPSLTYQAMDMYAKHVPKSVREVIGGKAGLYASVGTMAAGIVLPELFFVGVGAFLVYRGCDIANHYANEEWIA